VKGSSVSLSGVVRRHGSRCVLQGIDLEVEPGEFVAVVGRSGEGKTTLLRLLAGLDQPDAGKVVVSGKQLSGLNRGARIVFQDGRLLPWLSVVDNVFIGLPKNKRSIASQLLDEVGLSGRGSDWPSRLSGGQRQRVALARALAAEPSLLLLDEPLGSLDSLTRREMQQLVERLWYDSGCTAILVTHDVDEAVTLADRVLVLEAGGIALDIRVKHPRPRERVTVEFLETSQRILERLLGKYGEVQQAGLSR
jgi:sulfonate transport system ATP-binding protein